VGVLGRYQVLYLTVTLTADSVMDSKSQDVVRGLDLVDLVLLTPIPMKGASSKIDSMTATPVSNSTGGGEVVYQLGFLDHF
jgi:hypothetical protein